LSIGPAGDKGLNPYQSIGGEWDLLHAEAKGDVLSVMTARGSASGRGARSGRRSLGGKLIGRRSYLSILPRLLSIQTKEEAGGAVGATPGGSVGAWLYYDKQESRFHITGLLGLEFILKGEYGLDISIGKNYQPPDDGGGTTGAGTGGLPNPIAKGEPTVLIGD
jgi:hypothetical protein